jgi:hypothetical protein
VKVPRDNPFKDVPLGTQFDFEINRTSIQKGTTFSESAMREVLDQVNLFVATQVAKRWEETGEPPSALTVHVSCDVG